MIDSLLQQNVKSDSNRKLAIFAVVVARNTHKIGEGGNTFAWINNITLSIETKAYPIGDAIITIVVQIAPI